MIRFAFVIAVLWLFTALGFGNALPQACAATCAESDTRVPRLKANSNQTPAGVWENGALDVNLEVREGEWFPEDEHGPSLMVFALAERGKPAQIPGPIVRVREGTTVHATIHNLLSVTAILHGMHQHPGKTDEVLEIPSLETKEVTFLAGESGAY